MPFDGKSYGDTVARKIRAAMGPNGEKWCKNAAWTDTGRACLLGWILAIAYGQTPAELLASSRLKYVQRVTPVNLMREAIWTKNPKLGIPDFNDAPETTFADIEAMLERMHELEIAAMVENANAV